MPHNDLLQPELGAYRSGVVTPEDFAAFWEQTIRTLSLVILRIIGPSIYSNLTLPYRTLTSFLKTVYQLVCINVSNILKFVVLAGAALV